MPFFEITNAQLCFHSPVYSLRSPMPYHGKGSSLSLAFGYEQCVPCARRSSGNLKKEPFHVGRLHLRRGRLLIKAVATFEPKTLAATGADKFIDSKDLQLGVNPDPPGVLLEFSDQHSEDLDDREKLRRMRISKANKGNTPWNKGRKHSAETLRKIKERTRLAMQNPKVKMKLANLGHAQTTETRLKIANGVRMGWDRRRGKKMVQETCCFEWQNLIAEASRKGYADEEELQWDSYETLDEQLKQEWLASAEQRKRIARIPGSKRAPKSLEQRRKIAEAIAAKWADPGYRDRVCSGLAKYHGTEDRPERKPRRKPSDGSERTRRGPMIRKDTDTSAHDRRSSKVKSGSNISTDVKSGALKRSKSPAYKDPLVNSKLEMIKSIRAQRAAAETEQAQAIGRARLLIAEAEKAAKALEAAAAKSPIAQASLIESRKLIAEAIQSLQSIEISQEISETNVPSVALSEVNEDEGSTTSFEALNQSLTAHVNGHTAFSFSANEYKFSQDFGEFSMQMQVKGDPEGELTSSNGYASLPSSSLNSEMVESSPSNEERETEQDQSSKCKTEPSPPPPPPSVVGIQPIEDEALSGSPVVVTKKWIRGRLVEVEE